MELILNTCHGNSYRVTIDLQHFVFEKKTTKWKISHPLQDRVKGFELYHGWKVRIEQLQPIIFRTLVKIKNDRSQVFFWNIGWVRVLFIFCLICFSDYLAMDQIYEFNLSSGMKLEQNRRSKNWVTLKMQRFIEKGRGMFALLFKP